MCSRSYQSLNSSSATLVKSIAANKIPPAMICSADNCRRILGWRAPENQSPLRSPAKSEPLRGAARRTRAFAGETRRCQKRNQTRYIIPRFGQTVYSIRRAPRLAATGENYGAIDDPRRRVGRGTGRDPNLVARRGGRCRPAPVAVFADLARPSAGRIRAPKPARGRHRPWQRRAAVAARARSGTLAAGPVELCLLL